VQHAANKFFDDLQAVIPEGPVVEWPAHPYVQLQLSKDSTKAIVDAPIAERQALARKLVLSEATVSDSDKHLQALFGKAELDNGVTLQHLYDTWKAAYPRRSDSWIDALAEQVGRAAQWQFPTLKWAAMPGVGDGHPHAPVVTRVRKIAEGSLQFDVYFYPFNLLDATPAQSRMVRRADMLCRVVTPGDEREVSVMDLLRELDANGYTRMPFVDSDDRLIYIAHRSMIDQFVSKRARAGNVSDLGHLSMADMFVEQPELRVMFSRTAAFVGSESTLAEAKTAMEAVRNCYDVFVTDSGSPQEPVLGWVTDVIIAASEPI
jgi:CBS domain-containing protein